MLAGVLTFLKILGIIDDDPTPKIQVGGGTAYTLNSRDYKRVMIVVVSDDNRTINGEQSSRELQRTGCLQ